jgi:hypothetical protein
MMTDFHRNTPPRMALKYRIEEQPMKREQGSLGILVGTLIAIVALFFVVTGSMGGKKTIESDRDLPPVASGTAPGK